MPDSDNLQKYPPWLKAMQNCAIGEARAKAFLLDRFWVLERSVDIEGADLIIQRRLTGRTLLDREAPRLGVVQVKYFGTSTTSHFVHREYAVNEENEPRDDFFVLCFMGNEQNQRAFYITGKDLFEQFPEINKGSNNGFAISYKQITSDSRFEIINPKLVLDRMEKRLEFAEFTKNRKFISWALPSSSYEPTAIQPEYSEPIQNWWGDIPSGFEEIKRVAQSAMIDVEEIYDLLQKLSQETDPLKAEEILKGIRYKCRDGQGNWGITLPDDLYNGDFFTVCRQHKEIYENLKSDGLLDSFLNMKEDLRERLMQNIEALIHIDPNCVHSFTFTYNPESLKILSFDSKILSKQECNINNEPNARYSEGIVSCALGKIEYSWCPGAHANLKRDEGSMIEWYRSQDFWLYYKCLDTVFLLKYYDGFDV